MAIMFALTVVLMQSAQAQTYTVLHNFTGGQDGATSFAGLTMDKAGNLYGTTYYGGGSKHGVVFKLIRKGGSFVFNTLHSFGNGEGIGPYAKVTIGPDGGLYGTTQTGISGPGCGGLGCGTGFRLSLPPTACISALCDWSESLVYQFPGGNDALPSAAVVFDQEGNMFGTTTGDLGQYGNVYELQPSNGGWTQNVLYSFTGGEDGSIPQGDVIRDQAGNLYGVTFLGGTGNLGVVYQLVPTGDGGWKENVLHNFDNSYDGGTPAGGLILDNAGNLYGTTGGGGGYGIGTVFMLSPAGGAWTSTVLHSFSRYEEPSASLTWDAAGNLYGTTLRGGKDRGGTIFKMTPGSGGWTYTVLKEFDDPCTDGCFPNSDVTIDASGNLYGTTEGGGTHGNGVVWQITP